jgi:predicted DNA-binding transcriptional regulator AlpA
MESNQENLFQLVPKSQTSDIISGVLREIMPLFEKYRLPPKDEPEELLTVEETLKFLKCSKQALWNWRKNGVLPSYRLGNRVYYKKSDIWKKLIKQE